MRKCCGSAANCSCKVEAGRHIEVTGTGGPGDPLVIKGLTTLTAEDNEQFNVLLTGSGTLESPWSLSIVYAGTASLGGLPDVNTTGVTNGQVLGYNTSQGEWVPIPPTTATPGLVVTGNGVDGDGSVGDPLVAVVDAARYITLGASGIGLSDAGINRTVRIFATEFARDNANPAPSQGTVALVETDVSVLWEFDGTDWVEAVRGRALDNDGQFLATSGSYSGGPLTQYIRQIDTTTDGSGAFVALPAADLTDYSGVLSVRVTPTGAGAAWVAMPQAGAGLISARALRVDNGAAHAGATITAIVEATLY